MIRRTAVLVAVLLSAACGGSDLAAPTATTSTSTTSGTTPTTLEAAVVPESDALENDAPEIGVSEASIAGASSDGTVRWDVRYPQLDGLPVDAVVNDRLRTDAEDALALWRRDAEGWGATADLPSEYLAGYEVTLLDARFLSVAGSGSAYLSGAAHPVTLTSSATFDLASGDRIVIDDLFTPGSAWRDVLLSASADALQVEFGDTVEVESLDLGPSTDLSFFVLTPTGLRLTFAEGTIGPHALGAPSVTIPYDTLASVAAPDGALQAFLEG